MNNAEPTDHFFIEYMEEIDLSEDVLSKAKWAVLFEEPILYLVFASLVILGLETYYSNMHGDGGTIYISGFFSWVVGALLIQLLYRRIKRLKQTFRQRSDLMGGSIFRHVCLNDEGLVIERERIDRIIYYWTGFSGYEVNKQRSQIILNFGLTELTLSDKKLGEGGMQKLLVFLEDK